MSRLPIPPEARPKSVTIAFADPGDGNWTTHVDIVDAGGMATHAACTSSLKGTPEHVNGDFIEADTSAVTQPVPNVLVMNLARGGVQTSTRVYAVAADGNNMIETASYMTTDGHPVMRTNYFQRAR